MDLALAIRIAIVVAAALLLWWLFAGYLRRDREKTEHMLDPFLPVLESPLVGRSPGAMSTSRAPSTAARRG